MSAKYQRLKQQDLLLPAPLRRLTRTFSSITLAVILLACVALYGMIASVPIAMLAKGLLLGAIFLATTGLALGVAYGAVRGLAPLPETVNRRRWGRWLLALLLLTLGVNLNVWGWSATQAWTSINPWFTLNRATVIYRLPYFEMTELEFYNWWPLKLILALFVVNMIWATLRRIEFKFVNLGVLMVHTGIVTIAVASIFYGFFKVEGDTLLWRQDLGGRPVAEFYDKTAPAMYFTVGAKRFYVPLPHLPRYNDYPQGTLDIRLHQDENFRQLLGPHVRATIRGFISYGQLTPQWVDAAQAADDASEASSPLLPEVNPALRLALGDASGPKVEFDQPLVATVPAQRVTEETGLAVEFLLTPDRQRLDDLLADFPGRHGLVVDVPAAHFHAVYGITPGQVIPVGATGYTLKIAALGPYGMSFVTPGYEGAQDTRALIEVTHGQRMFRRLVMHRYPERSQDFVPAPNDPNVDPLGKRSAPDPAIRLAYIDASQTQFHIIAPHPDLKDLLLLARARDQKATLTKITGNHFVIASAAGREVWFYITQRILHARQILVPASTPKNQRLPKDEGTYLHALVPLDIAVDVPGSTRTWKHTIWLTHMRYPDWPDDVHRPITVNLPGLGPIQVAFSRVRLPLPFAITLTGFAMQPYPGTRIPRDFNSFLDIHDLAAPPGPIKTIAGQPHLNNPFHYRGYKISQTGWDPGDTGDPQNLARDEQGRFTHQQRYSILGIGNNVGIHALFTGACLIALGIPWAFYIKPALVHQQSRKLRRQAQANL